MHIAILSCAQKVCQAHIFLTLLCYNENKQLHTPIPPYSTMITCTGGQPHTFPVVSMNICEALCDCIQELNSWQTDSSRHCVTFTGTPLTQNTCSPCMRCLILTEDQVLGYFAGSLDGPSQGRSR